MDTSLAFVVARSGYQPAQALFAGANKPGLHGKILESQRCVTAIAEIDRGIAGRAALHTAVALTIPAV